MMEVLIRRLFTGCGSTYYLAIAAGAVFQSQTGIPGRGLPASEIWLDPAAAYSPKQRGLRVAVSRLNARQRPANAVD